MNEPQHSHYDPLVLTQLCFSCSCDHAVCNCPSFNPHVPQHIIKKLIKALCRQNHCAVSISVEDGTRLFACLHGPVQSGKTNAFNMVALVLFLKYNLGTMAFLLNNASVYSSYPDAVRDFNERLVDRYGLTTKEAKRISLQAATLRSDRKGLTRRQLEVDVPAVYGRILRTGNVRSNIVTGMGYIEKCGVDAEGYINAVLIVDEGHNLATSQNGNKHQLERAVHEDDYKELRETMRDYLMTCFKQPGGHSADLKRIDAVLEMIDARGWHADKLFKGVIYVTATTSPIALTESRRVLQLLQVTMPVDYFGYDESVPAERRIDLVEEDAKESSDPDMPKLIAKTAWVVDRLDEYMAPDMGLQHVLIYAQGRNAERFDVAQTLAHRYKDVPFVAICLIGSYKGFGACMVFSQGAAAIASQIVAADQALHCNKGDLHVTETKPPPGAEVMIASGESRRYRPPWGGHLEAAVAASKACLCLDAVVMDGTGDVATPIVHFVNSAHYRDRVLLDILNKARALAGVAEAQLKIVGIGMQLLREGVTLKTTDHKLTPTAMLYTCTVTDDVKLIQATGRIAGRQQGARPPKLHARKQVVEELQAAYARNVASNECMEAAFARREAPAVAAARHEFDPSLACYYQLSQPAQLQHGCFAGHDCGLWQRVALPRVVSSGGAGSTDNRDASRDERARMVISAHLPSRHWLLLATGRGLLLPRASRHRRMEPM